MKLLKGPLAQLASLLLSLSPASVLYAQDSDLKFHKAPKARAEGAVNEDWPSIFGRRHQPESGETGLIKDFPAGGPALVWERRKGTGYATPTIAGKQLMAFHRVGDFEELLCLDRETGQTLWSYRSPTSYVDEFGYNNGPRASPVIDSEAVYIFGAEGTLQALRRSDGRLLWKKELRRESKADQGFFGVTASPLLVAGRLYLNLGGALGTALALDAKTGERLWSSAEKDWGASYASPVPYSAAGQDFLLVFAGGRSRPPKGGLMVFDRGDGRLCGRFPWRSKEFASVNASTPVIVGDKVFISASYETGGALLKIKPDGSLEELWTSESFGTHFNTAVCDGVCIYGFDGRHSNTAELVAFDIATGKERWRETPSWESEVSAGGGRPRKIRSGFFRGSLLKIDGRVLALGENGALAWLRLSPEGLSVESRADLFYAPETWCLPVVSHGLLYIAQNSSGGGKSTARWLCYDLRAEVAGREEPR